MILNRIKKLLVVVLCALLVLPILNVEVNSVNAAGYDHTESIYVGVNYAYYIGKEDIKNAKIDDITIFAKKTSEADEKYVEIFKDKKDASETDKFKVSYLTGNSSSSADAKVTIMIREVGEFDVKVQAVKKDGDTEKKTNHLSKFIVTSDLDKDVLTPKYHNLYTVNDAGAREETVALKEYKDDVKANKNGKNGKQILAGDDYVIPKLESLVSSLIPYENLKKTLYYAAPNSTSYSTKTFTKADGTFTISSYGTYRFYVTFYVEKFDKFEEGITVGTEGLEEKEDGFYRIKDGDKDLYAKKVNNSWVYYVDEEYKTKFEGKKEDTTAEIIIPIFSFTLENKGPNVKISTSYQEDGFVDLKYTLSGITISGNDVQVEYTLQYRKDKDSAWATAEEKFDKENLSFTPSKTGLYRIKIDAIDATGLTTEEPVFTKDIVVEEKYQSVSYKKGFREWISVNALSFTFLCISGACLIAIILILVINPKDKVSKAKEEDR